MALLVTFPRWLRGLVALAIALACLAPSSLARAENPYDAKQRDFAARVSRAARTPEGIVPLLELWRNWDNATPGLTLRLLERLANDRRLSPARRTYVRALLARAALRMGDPEAAGRATRELGYLTTFRVVGPFDNEGKAGFENAMPPEQPTRTTEENASWPGKERTVTWRQYPDVSRVGYVNFDTVFRPNTNACGFAETMVRSEREQPITLWVGAGGAFKAWWNGEEVLRDAGYRHPDPDRSVASIVARQGVNRLLIKVCVAETSWGFFARLGDAEGGPARGIAADESAPYEVVASVPRPARARALESDFQRLEASAAREDASATALESLARFLVYTGSDDPAERRAPDLAARAAERDANIARLRLAATLAEQRGEAMRFVVRAKEVAPDQPETLLLEGIVRQGGPSPEDALPLLERLREGTPRVEGAMLRANILRDLGLVESALQLVKRARDDAPEAPTLLRAYAESLEAAGRDDSAIEARQAAVAARFDDMGSRRVLAADALYRGDADGVIAHIAAMRSASPDDETTLLYAAGMYEAMGRGEDANEAYQAARSLAPEDAELLVAHGQFLLRKGQASEATTLLRRAMVLRPQDAETRELLEHIRPEGRFDERYAIGTREILARRVQTRGYPVTVLQDLTVNTVFNNGLGSSFRQVAVQIHDAEGARRWRTYSIQFDPDSQRVDIRLARVHRASGGVLEAMQTFERPLGEPWYRVYYDTRALVVAFPDLEPGDTVELRYRLDNVAHRNLFADYYGDLHFLQDFEPTRSAEYVLITPSTREFFFNEPRLSGLRHSRQTVSEHNIDRWIVTDVPAVREEDRMPGRTAVTPYLHVSTYRTWQDVGRWYWGLIRDQLYADESLKRTVRELVANAPDLRTKVTRIHNWVVRNTRYVALEFGIHGYKPYRVPQIVQRGFGDCKDKASLIYTMLREAGVDARIVLVRTRRNGMITDLPASLAIFDHAIAYVPELDLYLDGTAEHSGTTELPAQDQGVTVLVVGPNGAELRRTPVLPADRNRRTRRMDVRLAADGSAEVRVDEEVRGDDASFFRRTFQAQGTRQERLEESLRQTFPGLELISQSFGELSDLERPVRFGYQARIPQMARRDGTELRIASAVLDDLVRSLARTPARRYALDLGGTSSYVEERVVHVPEGMRIARAPQGGEIASEFGRLVLTVQNDAGRVQTRTEFELSKDLITADEYAAFRAWVDRGDALMRQRIVLAPAGGGAGQQGNGR